MINIHYSPKNSYFYFYLSELVDKDIKVKFDTGAGATILTAKALGIDGTQLESIKNHVKKKNIPKKLFKSATDTEFYGYLCSSSDVKMNDVLIKRFYFYLVLNNDVNKALLGDDFISCCTFSHQPQSDIIITTIDVDLYVSSYQDDIDCIDVSEVL